MNEIKRGDIYYINFCPAVGSEQAGIRPAIILQNDMGNKHSPTTIVAAITSRQTKTKLPTHIKIDVDGLKAESTVLLEQVRTIDKSRLREHIGAVNNKTMKSIDRAIAISFGIKYLEDLRSER